MADTKITALTALTAADPANDVIPIVDVSDTTMAASGTTKKITPNQILGSGGTATLASATITGDLTVDTNTLKVDSTNNRVGIGTASPAYPLSVAGRISYSSGIGEGADLTVSSSGTTFQLGLGSSWTQQLFYLAGAEAMRLNSTGLGVGGSPVTSHLISAQGPIAFGGTAGGTRTSYISNSAAGSIYYTDGGASYPFNDFGNLVIQPRTSAGRSVIIATSSAAGTPVERLIVDPTGNVGVGVTPSAWATYKAVSVGGIGASVFGLGSSQAGIAQGCFYNNGTNTGWAYTATSQVPAYYLQINGEHRFHNAIIGTAGNQIVTWNQAMTLDASGNLLVGTTSTSGNAGGLKLSNVAGNLGQITFSNNSGSSDYVARFNWGSTPTLVGNITVSSGGTAFNTTSDYRLKESVQPLLGGLARVSALKPSVYRWKTDGSNGEGFLAHELAEVVPAAVTGDKDAVNEDGSIKPQGVDLSKVVPILVAAIQELTARVQTLEAR